MRPCSRILFHYRKTGFLNFRSSSKLDGLLTKISSDLSQNRKFHSYPSGILGFNSVYSQPQKPIFGTNLSWVQSGVFPGKFDSGVVRRSENLSAGVLLNFRNNSTTVESRVNDKNFERIYVQGGLNVKPLLGKIDEGENIDRGDESRVKIEVEDVKNENSVSLDEAEVLSVGRVESKAEKEAWKLLRDAVVMYCGSPVGTLAASDPNDKLPLNYDQVFIRDFVPSALAFLLKGEGEIVRNFLLHTLQLQSWEKTVDCYSPGQGLMPASFKVRTVVLDEKKSEEVLDPDFGESAIGRVAPVDSGLWWIILLRAYGKITGDYALQERVDVQTGVKLILNLCLSDGFDMFPSLLVTDGSCMIDRRMGIHGHPLEIQEKAEGNPFSFSIAVRACTSIGSSVSGMQIHAAVVKCGLGSNIPVMNSILDMYCRCNFFSEAHQCFHGMVERDLVTWNTFIAGYEMVHPNESLYLFSRMESEGFYPNIFTYSSIIAACANLAALTFGQQVHGGIFQRGLEGDLPLSNALIDMYAKCGSIMDSCRIFSQMHCRDLVSWTSMLIGYGSHGYGKEAVKLFNKMVNSGIRPDRIVFIAVMGACSHAGMIDEGMNYFKLMTAEYNITPNQEVYGCVVDLLGRGGRVEEAIELIESMPFKPDESVWGALLGACKAHKISDLSKWVAERVLDSKPNMAGSYAMLSNIFAAEGNWADFARMRKLMRGTGNKKEAGQSWVEVRDQVYNFVVGDVIGHHSVSAREVIEIFDQHMQEARYVPDPDFLMHDYVYGVFP